MKKNRGAEVNLLLSLLSQTIIIFLAFANRLIFVKTLGKEYLGISGVITSVLSILQLAELGINAALQFHFYKPLYERDFARVKALLIYARHIYHIISIVILVAGLVFLPFLNVIIQTSIDGKEVLGFYLIFLLNTVASYLMVYKSLLLIADQKMYVTSVIKTVVALVQNAFQIYVLIYCRNYYYYLSIMLFCTLLNNALITLITNRRYHICLNYSDSVTSLEDKANIIEMIKSTAVYRVGVIIINNTDNILISIIVSTVTVGVYSNYTMILNAVNSFLAAGISALIATIGRRRVSKTVEEQYTFFRVMVYGFHYGSTISSYILFCCINDLLQIVFGKEYVLSRQEVFFIVLTFFVQHVIDPIWMHREAMGLFNEIKYIMLITAGFNIVFSIVLGNCLGLSGIVFATALSRIVTTVWYEPKVLYKKSFPLYKVKDYFILQLKLLIQDVFAGLIIVSLFHESNNSLFSIMYRTLIIIVLYTIIFMVCNRKTNEMNCIIKYVTRLK